MTHTPPRPSVRLVSHTQFPAETLAHIWWTAKYTTPVPPVEEIHQKMIEDQDYREEVENLFTEIIEMLLPCSRFVNFVFAIENVPISLREQLVRHKIGMEYWIQGARVTDMSDIYDNHKYRIPERIQNNPEAAKKYRQTFQTIQEAYKDLIAEGFLFEEARELLPSGATHRLSFVCNIESLHNMISKRTGWLLQGELWFPIIKGIVDELESKVSPPFRAFAHPPEISLQGEYRGYKFKDLAYDRYVGITKLPVDPIFYYKEKEYIEKRSGAPIKSIETLREEGLWDDQRVADYINFWGFDPSKI